jgi:glycosyl transferase family 87
MASSVVGPQSKRSNSRWENEPALDETLVVCLAAALIFLCFIAATTSYLSLVDNFGDNSGYMSIAAAICKWDFRGVFVKHFWGLPYFMCAISKPTGFSDRTALLLVSWLSSVSAVILAYRLWGGWIATAFFIVNFDWYQRSYLGGSEPLFVALLFGSFLAIRRERWLLAALLAALATITRPLGVFLLLGIGIALLYRRDWRRFSLAAAIGLAIGTLYVIPLALYFHDPLATVHSYEAAPASASVPLFGIPFYAIVKGTILHPAPLTNLLLTFGWIFLVLIAIVAMLGTQPFRNYAREHVPEMVFAAPYLLSLYCYNYPYWARGSFPRFAIPIIPFVFLALGPWIPRWIPKDRRLLWALAPVTAVLAASSAVGIRNVMHLLGLKG